jgi:hypothetical protein
MRGLGTRCIGCREIIGSGEGVAKQDIGHRVQWNRGYSEDGKEMAE